jgi:Fe-S oxidoreductase
MGHAGLPMIVMLAGGGGIVLSLGAQEAQGVLATGVEVVASGNIGCLNQLAVHLAGQNSRVRVRHTMQVLRDAYRAEPSWPEIS